MSSRRCGETCPTGMRLVLLGAALVSLLTTVRGEWEPEPEAPHWVHKVHAPSIVDPRDNLVVLRCDYDLQGQQLDAVNWYKDGTEMIYRFMPSIGPKGTSFPHPSDVRVSLERSNDTHLVLLGHGNVTKNVRAYEGNYLCEVQMSLTYSTDYASANITAAIVPRSNPELDGLQPNYHVGEQLEATCAWASSLPTAELTFLLNRKPIERAKTRQTTFRDPDGSTRAKALLTMRLDRNHFPGGSLTLACRATMPGVRLEREYKTEKTAVLAAQRLAQELPSIFAMSAATTARGLPLLLALLATALTTLL